MTIPIDSQEMIDLAFIPISKDIYKWEMNMSNRYDIVEMLSAAPAVYLPRAIFNTFHTLEGYDALDKILGIDNESRAEFPDDELTNSDTIYNSK